MVAKITQWFKNVRLVRFAAVGLLCLMVQYAIAGFLHAQLGFSIPVAAAFSFFAAAQLGFGLSSAYSWADAERVSGVAAVNRWVAFMVVVVFAVLLNGLFFTKLFPIVGAAWAGVVAIAVSGACIYVCSHYVVFRNRLRAVKRSPNVESDAVQSSLLPSDGVAFFMPVRNNLNQIVAVTKAVAAYFGERGYPYNIILVDDDSTDGTFEHCAELSNKMRQVRTVYHDWHQGYGATVRAGLHEALATNMPWIGFVDPDGRFQPYTSFDRLLAEVIEASTKTTVPVDAVVGARKRRADGWLRRATERLWNLASNVVLRHGVTDVHCGCKLFRRSAIADIEPELSGNYAAISPELIARLRFSGANVVSVPVKHHPRVGGKRFGLTPRVAILSFRSLLRVARSMRRRYVVQLHPFYVRVTLTEGTAKEALEEA